MNSIQHPSTEGESGFAGLNRLVTDATMATLLGCSLDEVRRRCRTGEFPHVRIGRKYRFTPDDYAAIVAGHRREANVTDANPWGIRRRGRAS